MARFKTNKKLCVKEYLNGCYCKCFNVEVLNSLKHVNFGLLAQTGRTLGVTVLVVVHQSLSVRLAPEPDPTTAVNVTESGNEIVNSWIESVRKRITVSCKINKSNREIGNLNLVSGVGGAESPSSVATGIQ